MDENGREVTIIKLTPGEIDKKLNYIYTFYSSVVSDLETFFESYEQAIGEYKRPEEYYNLKENIEQIHNFRTLLADPASICKSPGIPEIVVLANYNELLKDINDGLRKILAYL
jgi:hypothetical protein